MNQRSKDIFIKMVIKIKRRVYWRLLIRRKKGLIVRLLIVTWTTLALMAGWLLSGAVARALLPPAVESNLDHLWKNRRLSHYLDDIQLLVEPSSTSCDSQTVPILTLVTTAPSRFQHRDAIRETWGKHLPVYFIMGINGSKETDLTVDNYLEAKLNTDIIIYQLQDHYQNLTLKTALMMKWTLERCPNAGFMFKTDDDVLVNPWMLEQVVKENVGAQLLGYKVENSVLHRDVYNKWYLPRWLLRQDIVPEYLSGTGYLVKGTYIKQLLEAAYEVPLVNLEDVFFTYLVAKKKLGLRLTHDHRLSPHKPWVPLSCFYWNLASMHSLVPEEIVKIWTSLEYLGREYELKDVCVFYRRYFSSNFFLY